VAHCEVCCLRVSLRKDKKLPKHYGEDTGWLSWEQRVCSGSGTMRYVLDRQLYGRCRRPLSRNTCPCCGKTPLTLNKNGKFPKHVATEGGRCSLSAANHS
jgi:hypothetical protein